MLALAITESDVKDFMNRLLREDLFDAYEVRSVEIAALTRVDISGMAEQEQRDNNETKTARPFVTWSQLRPLVYAIIKNGSRPRLLKIVFACDDQTTASVHPNASALFLNLLYENGMVQFTAATSQKLFTMDKTLDAQWEEKVIDFFAKSNVRVQMIS